jgi:hypothetical protein
VQVVDKIRGFLLRKRRWYWLLAAAALILAGHLLKDMTPGSLAGHGKALTERIATNLKAIQPGAIADLYADAGRGRHGLWLCGPTTAPPPPFPHALSSDTLRRSGLAPLDLGPPSTPLATPAAPRPSIPSGLADASAPANTSCSGIVAMVDGGILMARVTPAVALRVWHTGGWLTLLLFALTLGGIGFVLAKIWGDAEQLGCAVLPYSFALLAFGPLAMSGVFWLALKFLLLLTQAVGTVFAGIGWLVANLALAWKICALGVETLKKADEIEENAALAATTIKELKEQHPDRVAIPPN